MITVAVIGSETSHSMEFPGLMQAPDYPKNTHAAGKNGTQPENIITLFDAARE